MPRDRRATKTPLMNLFHEAPAFSSPSAEDRVESLPRCGRELSFSIAGERPRSAQMDAFCFCLRKPVARARLTQSHTRSAPTRLGQALSKPEIERLGAAAIACSSSSPVAALTGFSSYPRLAGRDLEEQADTRCHFRAEPRTRRRAWLVTEDGPAMPTRPSTRTADDCSPKIADGNLESLPFEQARTA